MLNPFFLQGSNQEQGLVQDLINEQLRMYGVDVYYLPRQIFSEGKVIRDVIYSKFNNAFPIEAYIMNYEGFDQNSVLMSKFGVKITDEMTLIISKERYELYISELIKRLPDIKSTIRPCEGDLIYVPLSDSLMEIKFVENRKPFYQLNKNYVYELRCEVYEIEDDEIVTGNYEVDSQIKDFRYSTTLVLSGIGTTATATTQLVNGGIQKIDVIDGGYGFSSIPDIFIEDPESGQRATSVAIMADSTGLLSKKSVSKIYIENPGSGYTSEPNLTLFGGGGYGVVAKVSIASSGSIGPIILNNPGQGYVTEPTVTISPPNLQFNYDFSNDQITFDSTLIDINSTFSGIDTNARAVAKAFLNGNGGISTIRIINAGYGYTEPPTITISAGSTVSSGDFIFNETVTGSISGASGLVTDWNSITKELKVSYSDENFVSGDIVTGSISGATYSVLRSGDFISAPGYEDSETIQEESDLIIDFSEKNPFGEV